MSSKVGALAHKIKNLDIAFLSGGIAYFPNDLFEILTKVEIPFKKRRKKPNMKIYEIHY